MVTEERVYGGMTAAERANARKSQLLDAALELISNDGVERLTINGLCAAAGLNERYFYESFKDRQEVLVAVFDRVNDEVMQALHATESSDLPESQLRSAITTIATLFSDDQRKARVYFLESQTNAVLLRRRSETIDEVLKLSYQRGEAAFGGAYETKGLMFEATYMVGGFTATLAAWLTGALPITKDELVDHSVSTILSQLSTLATPDS